eukprot:4360933-Amphidinium_carterae.1
MLVKKVEPHEMNYNWQRLQCCILGGSALHVWMLDLAIVTSVAPEVAKLSLNPVVPPTTMWFSAYAICLLDPESAYA